MQPMKWAWLAILALPIFAQATSLPGIPESGDPSFQNQVTVELSRINSGFQLTATLAPRPGADITFSNGGTTYGVGETGDSFVLTANFNKNGTLLGSSNVEIRGQLPTYPGTENSPLYKAKLDEWNMGFDSGNFVLGFQTTNPTGWARQFQCTPKCGKESVYLTDFSNVQGFWNLLLWGNHDYWSHTKNGVLLTATAHAVTTVPLPAAAWLFISGLAGLAGQARRRKLS